MNPSSNGRLANAAAAAALLLALGSACAPLPTTPPVTAPGTRPAAPRAQRLALATTPVCHECFWTYQPAGARAQYAQVVRERHADDPLVAAELHLVAARVSGDSTGVCSAAREFASFADGEPAGPRRLLAIETVAFTAAECGAEPAGAFRAAAAAARAQAHPQKAAVYDALAADTLRPLVQRALPAARLVAPPGTRSFTLGASAIRVDAAAHIVAQLERVGRDWLSYQLSHDFARAPSPDAMLTWHEGARLRDVIQASGARLTTATGVLAVHVGEAWLAADSAGVFRFEVLPDKVQYPGTRSWRGVALLVDTHGISALVDAAQRADADLVVGCGDYTGKMAAAEYLAAQGIDVYFPTDRFVGEVLGYQGSGTLIGSAPVRREGDVAVIGGRPVEFSVSETIVVQETSQPGELQYYDAPARYFRNFAAALPLQLEFVSVDSAGQARLVLERARQLNAHAVGIRVWTDADEAALAAWLAADGHNRAVLFHSAAYPAGMRIFEAFPRQATFGDPRPRFAPAPAPTPG